MSSFICKTEIVVILSLFLSSCIKRPEVDLLLGSIPSQIDSIEFKQNISTQKIEGLKLSSTIYDTPKETRVGHDRLREAVNFVDGRLFSVCYFVPYSYEVRVSKTQIDIGETGYLYNNSDYNTLVTELLHVESILTANGFTIVEPFKPIFLRTLLEKKYNDSSSDLILGQKGNIYAVATVSYETNYSETTKTCKVYVFSFDASIKDDGNGFIINNNYYAL